MDPLEEIEIIEDGNETANNSDDDYDDGEVRLESKTLFYLINYFIF